MDKEIVVTIDNYDVFGQYRKDDILNAMQDLYHYLKTDIEQNYTVEEINDYHRHDLKRLSDIINDDKVKGIKEFNQFLKVCNELAPNEYQIK
ncbi:hypothetical protein [Staphylococcus warneri]|uniref:Uncharacterized protein n=1 Tax=Staphylococcus warneri TaxID=1292 RepID=A0A8B2ZKK0_STAWA|nr:hypothetical protein [Staphylococcus warneri]RGM28346.1 hypothetical protein DXC19_11725 [Staphylococcus warneri]